MAQVINNPAGARQIWEEEHGFDHHQSLNLPGHKKGRGQRKAIYLGIHGGGNWRKHLSPDFPPKPVFCISKRNDFENCPGGLIFQRASVELGGTVFGAPISQGEINLIKSVI